MVLDNMYSYIGDTTLVTMARREFLSLSASIGLAVEQQTRLGHHWSELLKRVFAVDILECPRCFGRMKIIAAIQAPEVARKILDCLGLSSRPPPVAPVRTAYSNSFE